MKLISEIEVLSVFDTDNTLVIPTQMHLILSNGFYYSKKMICNSY